MKVMVIVKASAQSEAGEMPSEELLTAMGNYNEELVKAGVMMSGEGLHPTSRGKRVRFSGPGRTVIDGPFTETKEQIAGFWIWKVSSMEEAVEWLKRCPNPMNEDSEVEIRQIFSAEDFGAEFTPELREQEASLRAQTLGLGEVRYENSPARRVVGLNVTYTPATRHQIGDHWHRFIPRLAEFPGPQAQVCYGVCWNSREGCTFDYLTGIESAAKETPAEMQEVTLPAGRYAVFTHAGHVSELPIMLDTLWGQWAPDCGLDIAASPSFELYTQEFNPDTGRGGMEFWVPLKPSHPDDLSAGGR